MQATDILYPVFVLVALTFGLQMWMAYERGGALRRGEVRTPDVSLGQRAWPERATKVANAFHNQLELPILFYLLAAFALITSRVDTLLLILAWIYVALRILHAYIHTTDNDMSQRFYVFAASTLVLIVMWIYFAIQIIVAGP